MFNIDDLGFIVLCPELKYGGLRTTISTIKSNFNNAKFVSVVSGSINEEDMKTASRICPLTKGGKTLGSMINAGLKESRKEWNLVVLAGYVIHYGPLKKYVYFTRSEKDILYRVVDKVRWRWEDSSLHGLMINKKALKEVGNFPEGEDSFQKCKILWGSKAIENGYNFKGLVGVKLI